jgi:hypothetical protein
MEEFFPTQAGSDGRSTARHPSRADSEKRGHRSADHPERIDPDCMGCKVKDMTSSLSSDVQRFDLPDRVRTWSCRRGGVNGRDPTTLGELLVARDSVGAIWVIKGGVEGRSMQRRRWRKSLRSGFQALR